MIKIFSNLMLAFAIALPTIFMVSCSSDDDKDKEISEKLKVTCEYSTGSAETSLSAAESALYSAISSSLTELNNVDYSTKEAALTKIEEVVKTKTNAIENDLKYELQLQKIKINFTCKTSNSDEVIGTYTFNTNSLEAEAPSISIKIEDILDFEDTNKTCTKEDVDIINQLHKVLKDNMVGKTYETPTNAIQNNIADEISKLAKANDINLDGLSFKDTNGRYATYYYIIYSYNGENIQYPILFRYILGNND